MRPNGVIHIGKKIIKRIIIAIMGLFTLLKVVPMTTVTVSICISLVVYAVAFGFNFALGLVVLLFMHEVGHIIASWVVGIKATGPMFIPFFGAVINLKHVPINAKMEANIAIGGPALGTLSALICLVLYFWTDDMLMLVLSYMACILNLFNLIPCDPLDGGKIAAAISPRLWWVGTLVLGLLFFFTLNFLIFIVFIFSLWRLWQGDKDNDDTYYNLGRTDRIKVTLWYFGLVGVLAMMALYLKQVLN